jgi:lipoprotein-releasing system ATP-binding protein
MESPAAHLVAHHVYKDFLQGGKLLRVLRGISIDFSQNQTYAITGVSGSGKSTLLHLLGGLDEPTSGTILINNSPLNNISSKQKTKILNSYFGFVFQFHYLIKELTALENIILPGLARGTGKKACKSHARMLLESMGLTSKEDAYPDQLSGGEQQRVSIARALFNKPAFLLADEPTGNLDAENAQQVVNLLLKAHQEWGMGIILCSHDPHVYKQMQTIYSLHEGVLAVANPQ